MDEAELPPLEEGEEVLAAAVEPLRLVERAEADVADARLVGLDQRLLDHFVDVGVVLLHARQVEVAGDREAPRRALGAAVAVALDDGGRERVAAEERPHAEEGVERREPPPPPVLVRRHVRREPRQVHHRRGVEAVAEEDDVGLPRRLREHGRVQRVRRRVHLSREGPGGEGVRRRRAGGGAMRARPPNQRRRPFVRAPGAHRAAHVVPHRAEEDEVELELRVVEAVVRAGVQQPLERPLLRPARDELEVAVADAVEHVEEGEVEVDEGEGEAAAPRRHEEGEREVGEVAHALEQRVRRPRDRLGDDRGVVVLVRRLVHLRVVQEAVEDVVERLRRWRGAERSAQVAI